MTLEAEEFIRRFLLHVLPDEELTGCSLWQCPVCHKGRMLAIEILPRNHSRQTAITDTS